MCIRDRWYNILVSAYVSLVSQNIITDKLMTFTCILGWNYSFSVMGIFGNFLVGGGIFQFQNGNSLWSWRDPTIFGIFLRSNISSKLLELVTSNLVHGFVLWLLFDCQIMLTIVYCDAVRTAILATAWLLVIYWNAKNYGTPGPN